MKGLLTRKHQDSKEFKVFKLKTFRTLQNNDRLSAEMLEHRRVSDMDDNRKDSTDSERSQ